MKVQFTDKGLGTLEWTLPDELAAQLADDPDLAKKTNEAIRDNAREFCTALLSTFGNPKRLVYFNYVMGAMHGVYSRPTH